MKSVEDTLLGRRSIRRYERQPIEREKLDLIYAAIRNTPTSYNGQQFSVIAVTDQTVKEELYEITGQKADQDLGHFAGFLPRLSQAPRGGPPPKACGRLRSRARSTATRSA